MRASIRRARLAAHGTPETLVPDSPQGCVTDRPTLSSILFCGRWINLSAIARSQGCSRSYMSKMFTGERRNYSIKYVQGVAAALGMGWQQFLEALEERWIMIDKHKQETEIKYLERVVNEDGIALELTKKGKPAKTPMPGTRL